MKSTSKLSLDPSGFGILTPRYFLIGVPLLELPGTNIQCTNSSLSLSSRYIRLLQLKKQFWTRWSRDYLAQFTARPSKHREKRVIKVGDLAIVQEDSMPPLHWKLGRVVKVFPGKDQIIRVVELKVASGIIRRPVS